MMIALVPPCTDPVVTVPNTPVAVVTGNEKRHPSVVDGLLVWHEFFGIEGELKNRRSVPPLVNTAWGLHVDLFAPAIAEFVLDENFGGFEVVSGFVAVPAPLPARPAAAVYWNVVVLGTA